MLTQVRQEKIVQMLQVKESVSVQELVEALASSESTIRRDISALDQQGLLRKVFGGAMALDFSSQTEQSMGEKLNLHLEGKRKVAQQAAALLSPDDFVYVDAGSTTEMMLDFITQTGAKFVTNGLTHGQKLSEMGFETILLGGLVKSSTQAIVGAQAVLHLQKFRFTKGFFGTNGVDREVGFTTPDSSEAATKTAAMERCGVSYILADESKICKVAGVSFGEFHSAVLIGEGEEKELDF